MTGDALAQWMEQAGLGGWICLFLLLLAACVGYAWAAVMVIQWLDKWWAERRVNRATAETFRRFYAFGPERRKL